MGGLTYVFESRPVTDDKDGVTYATLRIDWMRGKGPLAKSATEDLPIHLTDGRIVGRIVDVFTDYNGPILATVFEKAAYVEALKNEAEISFTEDRGLVLHGDGWSPDAA